MDGISIRIAGIEKSLQDADQSWVMQQIDRRRADGQIICVQVTIHSPGIDMILSTPTCAGHGGGGRAPNKHERAIFDLWDKHHLNQVNFTGGSVCSFLDQLSRAA
jgi:hypothetical protein